jgi:hypothetical protein
MNLIPAPRRLRRLSGVCPGQAPVNHSLASVGRPEAGSYRIRIQPDAIHLQAADAAGLYYAEQTLKQIRQNSPSGKLPCLDLLDWPTYPVRGFYHDVTRGKVPTLATLLQLAETCAHYKLNHLQLYIEHTYAFRDHPEVWAGADPLSADDILKLDARCAELHIDLVPSFSTFGHFYTWIHRKFPELNELSRDVSADPFNWRDRMQHYTLNCQDPHSLALVQALIKEVRPLFRSRYFNICADETFDLGRGKNAELAAKVGAGRLYVDFLIRIMEAVHSSEAIPLFWGDVIGRHPELLPEIPSDAIALDWDYSATIHRSIAPSLAATGRPFYVCPGISGWSRWLPDYDLAHLNITRFARRGQRYGAVGMLTTDWGDYGHIHTFGPTIPGLSFGAAAAWNPGSHSLQKRRLFPTLSRSLWGDASGKLFGLIAEASSASRATWNAFAEAYQPCPYDFLDRPIEPKTGLHCNFFRQPARVHVAARQRLLKLEPRIKALLRQAKSKDKLLIEELCIGLLGLQVMEEHALLCHHRAGKLRRPLVRGSTVSRRLRELDRRLQAVWQARNRTSEYQCIHEVLENAARDCEKPR